MPYFGPKMGQPGSVFNSECPKYYYCSALLVLSILRPESLIFYYLMRLMHIGKYRCMAIPSACLCSACMRAPDNWVLGPIYGTRSAMQQWEKKQNWQYIVNEPLMVGRLLSLLNDWLWDSRIMIIEEICSCLKFKFASAVSRRYILKGASGCWLLTPWNIQIKCTSTWARHNLISTHISQWKRPFKDSKTH